MNTYCETVIVGAGQAGLATAYHLTRRGRDCVVLDAGHRVGDQWRQQWDSLRLYSPARFDSLPGMPFPAPKYSFPGKDDVADYLEQYAERFELPVRLGTRVETLHPAPGGYAVSTGEETFLCSNVVVATGTFGRTPSIPEFAGDLDPSILQLHSSEYRRPAQLQEGPVLVVGAAHSGCDIAYEVAETHPTTLAGRDCGQVPLPIDSPVGPLAFPIINLVWKHLITRRTPIGRKLLGHIRFHGGPMLRVKRSDLARRGVRRLESRVSGVSDGLPVVDGEQQRVRNVVWATGFKQDFGWIHLPVFSDDGWPKELRGVVDDAPGLFFTGLSFQYAFSSMLLAGAGRDAAYITDRIDERMHALSADAGSAAAA